MRMTNGRELLIAGIDFREECPQVCYQSARMKEPELLPLDFQGQQGKGACFLKILSALKRFGKKEDIRGVIVLPDLEEESIRQFEQEACEAGFVKEQLQVISEAESLVHFVMHQSNDIWQHRVCLLEFGADEVRAQMLEVSRRTTPMLVQTSEPEYWYVGNMLDGGRDERLAQMAETCFKGKPVSAVFLTGTDFDAREYKKSREVICAHRRVFLAEQVYARGACMAAGMQGAKPAYLFLNEQTLFYNMGIRCRRGSQEQVHMLVSAGENWYDVQEWREMILLDEPVLEFVFQPMMGGKELHFGMQLTDLPVRPERTTRLLIEVHFSGPRQCEVKVSDLGFGELYLASDLYWMESFSLEEEEEYDGTGDDLPRQAGKDAAVGGADGAWTL